MYYHMTVAGLERDLPICPLNENLSIAGFVIFGDQELTVACARELLKRARIRLHHHRRGQGHSAGP